MVAQGEGLMGPFNPDLPQSLVSKVAQNWCKGFACLTIEMLVKPSL